MAAQMRQWRLVMAILILGILIASGAAAVAIGAFIKAGKGR